MTPWLSVAFVGAHNLGTSIRTGLHDSIGISRRISLCELDARNASPADQSALLLIGQSLKIPQGCVLVPFLVLVAYVLY